MLPFPERCDIETYYQSDEIYDYIGQGTFATVFKAICIRDVERAKKDQEVALKVFDKKIFTMEKNIRDVVNEVEILRHVDHAHCVKLLDYFQTPFHVVIVMNYVNGKELFQALKDHVFTEKVVCSIMHQLFLALNYLHETLHIVHRDVKPENILVTQDEKEGNYSITLVDFGLARKFSKQVRFNRKRVLCNVAGLYGHKLCECESEKKLKCKQPESERIAKRSELHGEPITTPLLLHSLSTDSLETDSPLLTTPCGTFRYAAPETIESVSKNGQLYTTRGLISRLDIYASGIIMYVMLSGTLPFRDINNKTALIREMENGPIFSGLRWEHVSAGAIELNRMLLKADAKLRPSAKEVLQHHWFSYLNKEFAEEEEDGRKTKLLREQEQRHMPLSEQKLENTEKKEYELSHREEEHKKMNVTNGHDGVSSILSQVGNSCLSNNNTANERMEMSRVFDVLCASSNLSNRESERNKHSLSMES